MIVARAASMRLWSQDSAGATSCQQCDSPGSWQPENVQASLAALCSAVETASVRFAGRADVPWEQPDQACIWLGQGGDVIDALVVA